MKKVRQHLQFAETQFSPERHFEIRQSLKVTAVTKSEADSEFSKGRLGFYLSHPSADTLVVSQPSGSNTPAGALTASHPRQSSDILAH